MKKSNARITMLVSLLLAIVVAQALNDRPVIGIMTIPSRNSKYPTANYSTIPASYVQFLESAGARVVPIPYDASKEQITFLLNQVNGVLFTGGGSAKTIKDPVTGSQVFSNVTRTGDYIIKKVMEANDNSEYFPLTVTCQGWEILVLSLSQNTSVLYTEYQDTNVQSNIDFIPDAIKHSRFWGSMSKEVHESCQKENIFLYDHQEGILPQAFIDNPILNDVLLITTLSTPVNGGPAFVSSAEGRKYPIYGNQFHPEKTAFVWMDKVNPPHTPIAVEAAQAQANFFINEARKNNRKFESEEILDKSLIYNWNRSQESTSFNQVYYFRTVKQDPGSWPGLFLNTKKSNLTILPAIAQNHVTAHIKSAKIITKNGTSKSEGENYYTNVDSKTQDLDTGFLSLW